MMNKLLLAGALGVLGTPCLAQTTTRLDQPGFNLFSPQQDIELGRRSADEIKRQMPALNDAAAISSSPSIARSPAVPARWQTPMAMPRPPWPGRSA